MCGHGQRVARQTAKIFDAYGCPCLVRVPTESVWVGFACVHLCLSLCMWGSSSDRMQDRRCILVSMFFVVSMFGSWKSIIPGFLGLSFDQFRLTTVEDVEIRKLKEFKVLIFGSRCTDLHPASSDCDLIVEFRGTTPNVIEALLAKCFDRLKIT